MALAATELRPGMTVRNLRSNLTATVTEPLRVTGDPLHVQVRKTMEGGKSNGKTKLTTWSLDNVEIEPVAQTAAAGGAA